MKYRRSARLFHSPTLDSLRVTSLTDTQSGALPKGQSAQAPSPGGPVGAWAWLLSAKGELWSAITAGALLLLSFILRHVGSDDLLPVSRACAWTSLALGLFHGGRAAWDALRHRKFDIDVLMVVGALLAAAMGAPGEGALLLFLFVLSGALEALAMQRTTRAVEALHKLMPTRATRLRPGAAPAEEAWEEIAPEALVPGDVLKVPPGESVAADGVVLSVGDHQGEGGSVNQASLTGESIPRTVQIGDDVFAGTVNVGNPLRVRVTRPAKESSLQRILDLVIQAQQQREPVQRFIDRFSEPYAIGVMVVSILVFFVWWRFFDAPLWNRPGQSPEGAAGPHADEVGALYVAITLLIVASPCAIIIATPTATLAGIARAARAGVLFKGGQAIERLSRLGAVCFDKTGTLTVGKPRVKQIHAVGWSDEDSLLAAAAALESESTHPIARAVLDAAKARNIAPLPGEHHAFTAGRGVSARLRVSPDSASPNAGQMAPARLGTLVFTNELIPACLRQRVQDVLESVQERGQIGVVIAHDEQAAVIVLADSVRPGAETLVRELHDLGVRPVVMLTGDNELTARAVAQQLRLDQFHAQLLPGDKVAWVERIKSGVSDAATAAGPAAGTDQRPKHVFTGVIGDGVNDAPALAAADVAIGIGSIGSDAALENADIVLLSDDLGEVPWAVRLARRVRRTIAINFILALSALVVMAVWTLVGSRIGSPVPLWVGVLGHEGGTLVVVVNSLLLLAHKGPTGGVRALATPEP